MIVRVDKGKRKGGVVEYLKNGKDGNRDLYDNRVPIYGDIESLDQSIQYANENKNWSHNYRNIVVGFSGEEKMNKEKMNGIVNDVIDYYTAGYQKGGEVVAYAELHDPIKKQDENGKERHPHIHISISSHNPLTDNKIQFMPPNLKEDSNFQAYLNEKYGGINPLERERQNRPKPWQTKTADRRQELKAVTDNAKDLPGLKNALKEYQSVRGDIEKAQKVETKRNTYFKLQFKDGQNINLRGKGFEHLEDIAATGKGNPNFNEILGHNREHDNREAQEKIRSASFDKKAQAVQSRIDNRADYIDKKTKTARERAQGEIARIDKLSEQMSFKDLRKDLELNTVRRSPEKDQENVKLEKLEKAEEKRQELTNIEKLEKMLAKEKEQEIRRQR